MSDKPKAPLNDFRVWLFYQTFRAYTTIVPARVRALARLILFEISPDVPGSLTSAGRDMGLTAVFVISALLTLIMSCGVVTTWTIIDGTFKGTDFARLYFCQDWVNIVNYAVLCPLFVGFGSVLIATTVQGWAKLSEMGIQARGSERRLGRYGSVFLMSLLILCFAFFANAHSMSENLKPAIYPKVYWFIDHVTTGTTGTRVLGPLGFYYGFLNFCLMLFSILVVATFLSQFRLVLGIGESLDRAGSPTALPIDELRVRLTTFTQSYLAGKLAVAAYMANALAWKTTQAKHSTNLVLYGGVLTLFGVVFLSIPRYYVELMWLRLREAEGGGKSESEYEDLRPLWVKFVGGAWPARIVAGAMDTLIIGGFIGTFWSGF
jgi:hypothetical protein